jgi:hypothetical protein
MRQSRRTTIVVETERLLMVRSQRQSTAVERWCDDCGAMVTMAALELAATVSATSQREIVRRVESGALHVTESADGVLLICLPSLWPRTTTDAKGERS